MLMQDPEKRRQLIAEYGQLRELPVDKASARGQRFNHFLAELLQSWGIKASSSIRASGEIDVGFELEGQRFVVEAKWEQKRTDTGPIAKLQKRLRQRLGGTIGLFVSMSGYTEDALNDLKEGEQLAVLCLSREHFEAMLSGFVPPNELLSELVTRAALRGEAYVSLTSLFDVPSVNQLELSFEAPVELDELLEDSIPGFKAEVAVSSLPFGQSGVAILAPSRILLTLSQGIFEVDLEKQSLRPWLPIPQCSRNVLITQSGSAYVVRKEGVARYSDGELTFVGGGLIGNVSLSEGIDGAAWAFSNGDPDGAPAMLLRLGEYLGDQKCFVLDYAPASGVNVAQIDSDSFLTVGSAGIGIAQLNSAMEVVTRDLTNPMGLARLSSDLFIVASDCAKPVTPTRAKSMVCLSEVNTADKTVTRIAELNLTGSVSELATDSENSGYLCSHLSGKGVVIRFSF